MSNLRFSKMQGAGNDFIVIDTSSAGRTFDPDRIRLLCDRRKGIGADGLILLSKSRVPGCSNVLMDFFNCDGSKADLCGNGLRCAAFYAYRHGLAPSPSIRFTTGGGELHAEVLPNSQIRIQLPLSEDFQPFNVDGHTVYKGCIGVPHAVLPDFIPCPRSISQEGRFIRNHPIFAPEGVNVNFVEIPESYDKPVKLRTYERGVEDETPACGTGIASTGYVLWKFFHAPKQIDFQAASGDLLRLEITVTPHAQTGMLLTGPAVETFRGSADFDSF